MTFCLISNHLIREALLLNKYPTVASIKCLLKIQFYSDCRRRILLILRTDVSFKVLTQLRCLLDISLVFVVDAKVAILAQALSVERSILVLALRS